MKKVFMKKLLFIAVLLTSGYLVAQQSSQDDVKLEDEFHAPVDLLTVAERELLKDKPEEATQILLNHKFMMQQKCNFPEKLSQFEALLKGSTNPKKLNTFLDNVYFVRQYYAHVYGKSLTQAQLYEEPHPCYQKFFLFAGPQSYPCAYQACMKAAGATSPFIGKR